LHLPAAGQVYLLACQEQHVEKARSKLRKQFNSNLSPAVAAKVLLLEYAGGATSIISISKSRPQQSISESHHPSRRLIAKAGYV
jgi:hypothetical protein